MSSARDRVALVDRLATKFANARHDQVGVLGLANGVLEELLGDASCVEPVGRDEVSHVTKDTHHVERQRLVENEDRPRVLAPDAVRLTVNLFEHRLSQSLYIGKKLFHDSALSVSTELLRFRSINVNIRMPGDDTHAFSDSVSSSSSSLRLRRFRFVLTDLEFEAVMLTASMNSRSHRTGIGTAHAASHVDHLNRIRSQDGRQTSIAWR